MIYTYNCPECGEVVRFCRVDDRDKQTCECGLMLKRKVIDSQCVCIPRRFGTNMAEINAPLPGHKDTSLPYQRRWV